MRINWVSAAAASAAIIAIMVVVQAIFGNNPLFGLLGLPLGMVWQIYWPIFEDK